MYSGQGKRKKRVKGEGSKATKPFRQPPRRANTMGAIPGLLRTMGTEKKVLFTGVADPVNISMALNSTGAVSCLNLIQVGSSMFNRIGRKIEMKSVRLSGQITTLAVTRATSTPDHARIMIIYDRQTNGAFPTVSDILQDTDQAGTNFTEAYSSLNMNNRERFVTIADCRITLPQVTNTAGVLTNVFPNANIPIRVDEFRKLRGLTTHFKADSNPAVIGDISTGALYIISLAMTASGAENFGFYWNVRLKYEDV